MRALAVLRKWTGDIQRRAAQAEAARGEFVPVDAGIFGCRGSGLRVAFIFDSRERIEWHIEVIAFGPARSFATPAPQPRKEFLRPRYAAVETGRRFAQWQHRIVQPLQSGIERIERLFGGVEFGRAAARAAHRQFVHRSP
jgi:hypothetical protein